MNILITAGGTSEQIDNVRSITNTSTGKLGSLIAEAFAASSATTKIYYVCAKTAVLPQTEKTEIIPVTNVASLETAIRKVLAEQTIDIIVHSMAVSDYRVKSVTSAAMLAQEIAVQPELLKQPDSPITETAINKLIENSQTIINNTGKISSNIENMVLLMERTPKIISLFQALAPKAILVGFKLLDNVKAQTLIDTAFRLLTDNKCSFVLANDLRDISATQHMGYLIDAEKKFQQYHTKEAIAAAIVDFTIAKRRALNERNSFRHNR